MKLFIIGPLPPPFGGISNHIERIQPYLLKNNIDYSIVNQYSFNKLNLIFKVLYVLIFKKYVHIHLFSKYLLIPIFFITNLLPYKKFILTIHNDRLIGNRFYHFLVSKSRFLKILVVSRRSVKYWSVSSRSDVIYLPAFIPCNKNLPKPSKYTRIIANVWSYYDGVEKDYGLDILDGYIKALPNVKFVLYIGDNESMKHFNIILPKASNFEVVYGANLAEEFTASDIFLRLNRVDAYGVSIVEAMCNAVPALVTNVCARPKGSLTFKSYEALFIKLQEVIACKSTLRLRYLENFIKPDFHEKLINIYKTQLNIL